MTQLLGLTGLVNMGTQCYINSCTQILVHTKLLCNILESKLNKILINDDTLIFKELYDLQKLMWSSNSIINHKRWIYTIKQIAHNKNYELFTGDDQNDLPEFLLFIIDCLHNSLAKDVTMDIVGNEMNEQDKLAVKCYEMIKNNYKNNYSEIFDLFYGIHASEITSLDNVSLSITPESFLILDIAIPDIKNPTIYSCLDHHYQKELLTGDSAWYNEISKNKQDVYKQFRVWSFPKILIISFKRFIDYNTKNKKYIDFPIDDLDLTKYVDGYFKDSYHYELYAICNHSGHLQGGHYTAYIKNNEWFEYNDTDISKIDTDKLVSNKSYCLFYKKKNIH